ncbi:hypothetical protein GGX14DRAFT_444746 [Mycena pura]|uniref:DUF6534 domain-containing protein n=1 Tax=Mycena pura TaxID=153505 RepID=A0AAD6VJN6_9AGAR|nr:hypothetical protein GGX14DRAFT_444746 [Mycena pura]
MEAPVDFNGFLISYGVELVSSWVNMMLYMLEIVLCTQYFRRPNRPLAHKIGVGAILLFDTLCTASVNANVVNTFMLFFGKESFRGWTIPTTISILMTYSTASITQLFLCQLYFLLSKNRWFSLFLVFLGFVHVSQINFCSVGAILCAANDLMISGCLGYEFWKVRSSTSGLRRVFFLSLASGAIVASTTLLMMILLLKGDIAFEFFFSCQGRVYALTLLVNFLSGSSSSASSASGTASRSNLQGDPHPLGTSDESLNKNLPPLPSSESSAKAEFVTVTFPSLRITTVIAPPSLAFVPYPVSPSPSPSPSSSQTLALGPPQTPRTIISGPSRADSLPASSSA